MNLIKKMKKSSIEQWWRSDKFFNDWKFRDDTLNDQSFQWFKKNQRIVDRAFYSSLTKYCNRDENVIKLNHQHSTR